jgi:hypothetical protein
MLRLLVQMMNDSTKVTGCERCIGRGGAAAAVLARELHMKSLGQAKRETANLGWTPGGPLRRTRSSCPWGPGCWTRARLDRSLRHKTMSYGWLSLDPLTSSRPQMVWEPPQTSMQKCSHRASALDKSVLSSAHAHLGKASPGSLTSLIHSLTNSLPYPTVHTI